MPSPPRILAFSGSARRASLNKKLLSVAAAAASEAGAEVTILDLKDNPIPLYDGDLEEAEGLPENALKLVELIASRDGLLVAAPEYNASLTPLLKNALDWCTRAETDPFQGKVAAVVSASPGAFGGIRAQRATQQLLLHLGCHVIPGQMILPRAHEAFDDSGALLDERARKSVRTLVDRLVETARKLA